MRFKFIDAQKVNYPLTLLCRVMQVSRGGYYAWLGRGPSKRSKRDAVLLVRIEHFHKASRRSYGSPRIFDDLRSAGENIGKKRVERLMRDHGIQGKHRRKFRCTTNSNHDDPIAPNLLNQCFEVEQPDVVWSSDITQLWTPQGWLYLAIVLDLFARYVVGWAMRYDITRQLVINAVKMAIDRRSPKPGLIFHSDQGSQYAANDTAKLLSSHGLKPSMSGKGNCYDNAVSESFFSSYKLDLGDSFPSRSQGRTDAFCYIETFYNPYRRHSFNGNISPRDTEAFFARYGRKPTGITDLLAEQPNAAAFINPAVEGAPPCVSEVIQTPCTTVQIQCPEVPILSI